MNLIGNPVLLQVQAPPRNPSALMGNSAVAIGLLLGAMVLGGIGLVAMALWRRRDMGGSAPAKSLELARMEMETLARLAIARNQQAEALQKERDARQLVEADSHVTQELLARSRDEKVRLGRGPARRDHPVALCGRLTLESARPLIGTKPGEADLRIAQSVQALNAAIRELRGFIAGLSPESLRATEFRGLSTPPWRAQFRPRVRIDVQVDDDARRCWPKTSPPRCSRSRARAVSNALRARPRIGGHAANAQGGPRLLPLIPGQRRWLRRPLRAGRGARPAQHARRARIGWGAPSPCRASGRRHARAPTVPPPRRMTPSGSQRVDLMLVDDSAVVPGRTAFAAGGRTHDHDRRRGRTVKEASEVSARVRPDVVLLDIRLPDGSGFDACRAILRRHPNARVIFLTSVADDALVEQAIRAGGTDTFLKEIDAGGLIRAIQDVAAGKSILDASVTSSVLQLVRSGGLRDPLASLRAGAPRRGPDRGRKDQQGDRLRTRPERKDGQELPQPGL